MSMIVVAVAVGMTTIRFLLFFRRIHRGVVVVIGHGRYSDGDGFTFVRT